MKNRAYKDFKEIADLLYKIEKTVINSEKEEYPDYKKLCQTLIKHINDDIIELMMRMKMIMPERFYIKQKSNLLLLT